MEKDIIIWNQIFSNKYIVFLPFINIGLSPEKYQMYSLWDLAPILRFKK